MQPWRSKAIKRHWNTHSKSCSTTKSNGHCIVENSENLNKVEAKQEKRTEWEYTQIKSMKKKKLRQKNWNKNIIAMFQGTLFFSFVFRLNSTWNDRIFFLWFYFAFFSSSLFAYHLLRANRRSVRNNNHILPGIKKMVFSDDRDSS